MESTLTLQPSKSTTQATENRMENRRRRSHINQRSRPHPKDIFKQLANYVPTQTFVISNNRNEYIITNDGLILYFKAGTFACSSNSNITITIKEYNKRSSMILGDVTTVADKEPIFSAGMLELRGKTQSQEVKVKPGRTIDIYMPNDGKEKESFSGFSGNRNNNNADLNWNLNELGRVLNSNSLDDLPDADLLFQQLEELGKRMPSLAKKVKQRIIKMQNNVIIEPSEKVAEMDLGYRVLRAPREGFINCDAWWIGRQRVDMQIQVEKTLAGTTDLKLVFKERKTVVPPYRIDGGNFSFLRLPFDVAVTAVAVNPGQYGKPLLGMRTFVTGNDMISMEMETVASLDELAMQLKVLDEK